jgi:RHS repeat-associated protein
LLGNYILFTSREFDAETGLYYNRARHLDPATGRWTTQDPLGYAAGDTNLYRYVGNMATLATDPSGNLAWFVAVPLVMSVGGFTWLTGSTALVSYRTTGSWWDAGTWGACWDGLRLGIQANVNGLASAARSLLTLGVWNEPWEVWAVDDADRPFYKGGFLAARFGWELLPTAGIGRLTQAPGQMGRWGRYALGWDAGQNVVQVGRGGYDIYENGLTWTNGLQVVGSLLGLGGNYTTWRRLPAGGASARTSAAAPSTPTTQAAVSTETAAARPPTAPNSPTAAPTTAADRIASRTMTRAEWQEFYRTLRTEARNGAEAIGNLPARQRGPVLSAVIDARTGQTFSANNTLTVAENLHPVLRSRLETLLQTTDLAALRGNAGNLGRWVHSTPGAHAEINALNQALWARQNAGLPTNLNEFWMVNRW